MNSFYNQVSGSGTKRGKAMNTTNMTLVSTVVAALGLAVALGAAPALAGPPDVNGCHAHKEDCSPGEDPDPTLVDCDAPVCIADVGKTFTDNTPARKYALQHFGTYTKIESNEFDKILETLTEGDAGELCNAYDVLIFNWSSPTIKNLSWPWLLDYMLCGGNVIVEDPRNVATLADDVSTLETTLHSRGDFPLTITLAPVPVLTSGGPLPIPNPLPESFDLLFVNKHIIFGDNSGTGLTPFLFLSLENGGGVVGLYGQFPGGGRIVLTGPDNNFHGDNMPYEGDPAAAAVVNHYNLLFNEINWLLE